MAARSPDPAQTREKILRQAKREFARRGYDGARVDTITARCRLSKNMLYYYFGSKRGLFVSVLEQTYERLRQDQHDVSLRLGDSRVALAQLVAHTFDALWRDPDLINLLNEENRWRGAHIKSSRRVQDLYNPLIETIRYVLERGAEEGVLRAGIDPVLIYLSLSSLCYHYISNQHTLGVALGLNLGSEEMRRRWLVHITDVVIGSCEIRDAHSAEAGDGDGRSRKSQAVRGARKVVARSVA